jgi:hypothetical protein
MMWSLCGEDLAGSGGEIDEDAYQKIIFKGNDSCVRK